MKLEILASLTISSILAFASVKNDMNRRNFIESKSRSNDNSAIGRVKSDPLTAPPPLTPIPTNLKQKDLVDSLIAKADKSKTRDYLVKLTEFPERYYQSENGVKAANWIKDQVVALNSSVSKDALLSVSIFTHKKWKQPSVIARLEPRVSTGPGDIVIAGSHFDTIAYGAGNPSGPNPGADDCASGSSVVYEALRVLVTQGFVPKRPIEFHWYSAEEEGIYGSAEVAKSYVNSKVNVMCYLNLDQSGYVKPGTTPTAGIFTDYTDAKATEFLRKTVSSYTTIKQADSQSQGGTDHVSWKKAGYVTAFAAESIFSDSFPYNDKVNSDGSPLDTIDVVDFDHLMQFVRNTIGFVVELSLA